MAGHVGPGQHIRRPNHCLKIVDQSHEHPRFAQFTKNRAQRKGPNFLEEICKILPRILGA
jgi:hypothetical protein